MDAPAVTRPSRSVVAAALAIALKTACTCAAPVSGGDGGTSSGSGGGSSSGASGAACVSLGSCYGNVACPVGSVCDEATFACCAYDNSSGGTSGRGSSSSTSSARPSTTGGSTSTGGSTGIGVSGPPPAPASEGWPRWHHDSFASGRTSADTSQLAGTVAWKVAVGAPTAGSTYENSPVVDGRGNIYAVVAGGLLLALSPDGGTLWKAQVGDLAVDPHTATPALLADGSLYVVSGNDEQTGGPTFWVVSEAGQVSPPSSSLNFDACPLVGPDGTLYEGDSTFANGLALALEPPSLAQLGAAISSSPEYAERVGVALLPDGRSYWCYCLYCWGVSALDAGFQPLPPWGSGPTVLAAPGPLVEATPDADLTVDLDAGLLLGYTAWIDDLLDGGFAQEGALAGIDLDTGKVRWTLPLPPVFLPQGEEAITIASGGNVDYAKAAPALSGTGTVYVGSGDGLRAVDEATGQQQWLFDSAEVTGAPAVGGDGTIFFGCVDGKFYGLYPDAGLRFDVATGGPVSSSPAIAGDGSRVYFLSDDGFLYAVH